jgi:hypothetical protein
VVEGVEREGQEMSDSKQLIEVNSIIGRMQKESGITSVTVCGDCAHASPGKKRPKWVCRARPTGRDAVTGEWLYYRCEVANDGDCAYFTKKQQQPASAEERPAETPQPQPQQASPPPKRWWQYLIKGD